MPEQGEAAVAQGAREGENAERLVHQRPGRPSLARDVARERLRMASVAGKVEGDRDEAVAGEGGREGGHEGLRAGEAVRDDDDGRGLGPFETVDGGGRRADGGPLDRETCLRAEEHEEAEPDRRCRDQGERGKGAVAERLPHRTGMGAAPGVGAASGRVRKDGREPCMKRLDGWCRVDVSRDADRGEISTKVFFTGRERRRDLTRLSPLLGPASAGQRSPVAWLSFLRRLGRWRCRS